MHTVWNYRKLCRKGKIPPVRNYREIGQDFSFLNGFLFHDNSRLMGKRLCNLTNTTLAQYLMTSDDFLEMS